MAWLHAAALGYTTLEPAAFHDRLTRGSFGLLIDTRRQAEWDAGHLPNATFIQSLQETRNTSLIDGCRSCDVGVYCRTGVRSRLAADVLEAAGFTAVYDVQGIVQWQEAGRALVGTASLTPGCAIARSTCNQYLSPPPPPRPDGWPALPPSQSLVPPPLAPPPSLELAIALATAGGVIAALIVLLSVAVVAIICIRRSRTDGAGHITKTIKPGDRL